MKRAIIAAAVLAVLTGCAKRAPEAITTPQPRTVERGITFDDVFGAVTTAAMFGMLWYAAGGGDEIKGPPEPPHNHYDGWTWYE